MGWYDMICDLYLVLKVLYQSLIWHTYEAPSQCCCNANSEDSLYQSRASRVPIHDYGRTQSSFSEECRATAHSLPSIGERGKEIVHSDLTCHKPHRPHSQSLPYSDSSSASTPSPPPSSVCVSPLTRCIHFFGGPGSFQPRILSLRVQLKNVG